MCRAVSSTLWSRRALLARLTGAGGVLAALPGCGFRPLYGEGGGLAPIEAAGPIQAELAAVQVGLIPERGGQLLRRALEQRLGSSNRPVPARYDLRVSLAFAAEPLGFRRDGTPSRVRYRGTATWWLLTRDSPPVQIATGAERENDAYNIPDQQFFAAEASRDAMERRLVESLSDSIAQRLAVTFRRRADTAVAAAGG
jgi:LPS-assembly lipoprotein